MTEIEKLLQKSVEQYQEILDRAVDLLKEFEHLQVQGVDAYWRQMSEMQDEARKTDETLLQLLPAEKADIAQTPLFRKRLDLIQQVVDKNNMLLKKTSGMMAVISNEITQLKHSRKAMAGYKSGQSGKGQFLKGSY